MSCIFFFRWDLHSRGGVSNYLDILTEGIQKKGVDVISVPNVDIHRISKIRYIFVIFTTFLNYKQLLKKYKPHAVQFHPSFDRVWFFRDILFLLMTPNKLKIIFFRGWREELFNEVIKINILRSILSRVINGASRIFVLSEVAFKSLKKIGIKSSKLKRTTTMVIADNYSNTRNFNSNQVNVLFCGRLERKKGIYELLTSARLVLKINKNINFNFVGSGSQINKLENLTKKYNLEKSVNILGNLRGYDKYEAYKNADLFILPSYTEGFPNVYTEALAAGLPILITKVGGISDVFKNGKNGFFIDTIPPSPRKIAELIILLSSNKKLREKMSINNTSEALENYDSKILIESMHQQYSLFYER